MFYPGNPVLKIKNTREDIFSMCSYRSGK